MNTIDQEWSKIVGLDAPKIQIRKWLKGGLLDQRRGALRGVTVAPKTLPQLAFLGNPGTGKTMVARMMGKQFHRVGILPTDKVIEVQITDLVGKNIGQTGPRTREKIKEAEGGILFVEEANRLFSDQHGIVAIEEIMSCMDSKKMVTIFSGHTKPMDRVISSNQVFRRAISNIFHFDDFTCDQLANILHLKLPTRDENSPFCGFMLDPWCSVENVAALIKRGTSAEQRRKMNGELVDQMLVKAKENLDSRIDVEYCSDEDSLVTITKEDLVVGLRLLRAEENSRGGYYSRIVNRINFRVGSVVFISSSSLVLCAFYMSKSRR